MFRRHHRGYINKTATFIFSFPYKLWYRIDVSLKHPISILVSARRGVGKTEFTNKLSKSKLIAPPPECIVWCYAKHQQDLFEEFITWNVQKLFLESWTSISRRTKEIPLYLMILNNCSINLLNLNIRG